MSFKFTVMIQKEENWYVAKSLENSIASQGKTIDEALANLKEALELYCEDITEQHIPSQTFITTMEVTV